ncbi:MAG: polyprenyl synthetase family protein [Pseudomonadota bacterium]|nr:polyprenyl synthetase family protein [Pseudomonadota bacterium]
MANRDPQSDSDPLFLWRRRIDAVLEQLLSTEQAAEPQLQAAMRHAVLLGGKRMRPLLVYATGTAFGAHEDALDAPAAAVELVHAYSLVHDDLPAMDDDALRRGQPTVHVAFDEATAILAGDALQSLAFAVLADANSTPTTCVAMLRELAGAAGGRGMCGGQALDLAATGKKAGQKKVSQSHFAGHDSTPARVPSPKNDSDPLFFLERLHTLKTGALVRASVRLGALAAGVDSVTRERLDAYADALGLAFQIRDDLLDVEGDSATLGKTAGKDAAQHKATFPGVLGIDAARTRLLELATAMEQALSPFDARVATLSALGQLAIDRSH